MTTTSILKRLFRQPEPECDEPDRYSHPGRRRWIAGESEIGYGVYDRATGEECAYTEQYDDLLAAEVAAAVQNGNPESMTRSEYRAVTR